MPHRNLQPGEVHEPIGVAGDRTPILTSDIPAQPTAQPATRERSISEILEAVGFAFSATGAGLQGRPLPKNPAVARREQALKERRANLEEQALKQSMFQSDLSQAETFLKLFKDVPEANKEKFKASVADIYKTRTPEIGTLLNLSFNDPSVGDILENFGVDPDDPFVQSLVQSQGGDVEATIKFLSTDQGQDLLKEQADNKNRPAIRAKLSTIVRNLKDNFSPAQIAEIEKASSPGGKELTVGEILTLLPQVRQEQNRLDESEMRVLERSTGLLLEQGIISDKAAADFKAQQRAAGLKTARETRPSDQAVSRRIIGERLDRDLRSRGVALAPEELEGHSEFIRQTQGKAVDAEGRPLDVTSQVVFNVLQQEQQKQDGIPVFEGLSTSQKSVAQLLQLNPQDPSAKKIVQKFNKEADKVGAEIAKADIVNSDNALIEIETSLAELLGVNENGELNLGSADIPGFGVVIGGLPTLVLSEEGKLLRQQVQSLTNIVLKDRSGAAVTVPEFERFKLELGTGGFKTEAELIEGLRLARSGIERHKANLFSAHSGDAVKVFQSREGASNPRENVFPRGDLGSPRSTGITPPATNLGTRATFDPSKDLLDDASPDEIRQRIEFLNKQGVR